MLRISNILLTIIYFYIWFEILEICDIIEMYMKYESKKSVFGRLFCTVIVILLCICFVIHSENISTLLNHKAASASFGDIINTTETTTQLSTRAGLPDDYWADYSDTSHIASDFDGGLGTFEEPYLISTSEQLALMAWRINHYDADDSFRNANYQLTADLDMSGHLWLPMGRWESDRFFKGTLNGGGYTISNLLMKNHGDYANGTMSGFFGVLGDGAIITNLVIEAAVSFLDPNVTISERATMAILVSQVERNARVLISNNIIYDSLVYLVDVGVEYVENEVKAGVVLGWQGGSDEDNTARGYVYIDRTFVVSSSVLLNMYIDKTSWDMSHITVINSIGGFVGEARGILIQDSGFDGLLGVEMIRVDRNMDTFRYVFDAGGAIGTLDAPAGDISTLIDLEISVFITLDTFGNDETTKSLGASKGLRENVDWVADARQMGAIIGDTNIWGQGTVVLQNIVANALMDAPSGNRLVTQQTDADVSPSSDENLYNSAAPQGYGDVSDWDAQNYKNSIAQVLQIGQDVIDGKGYDTQNSRDFKANQLKYRDSHKKNITNHKFVPKASRDGLNGTNTRSSLEDENFGAPESIILSVGAGIAATLIYGAYLYGLFMGYGGLGVTFLVWNTAFAVGLVASFVLVVIVVIVIIAIVVLSVLFSIWAATRPKWESVIYYGSAIGSEAKPNIKLNNVHVANASVATDTMFSDAEWLANKVDSHNTTPTLGMITKQPESPKIDTMGQHVTLSVEGTGTIMADGAKGVDSYLSYQWFYNDIDINYVLDGSESGFGGNVTHELEGETNSTLDLDVDWVGTRYYFVIQVNNVLGFRGMNRSVTARVGNKNISVEPAKIISQPKDTSTNVSTLGNISVIAEATGTLSYQWYIAESYNNGDVPDTSKATLLVGAVEADYRPIHNIAGDYYYFVVVTASVVTGDGSGTVRNDTISDFAKVNVKAEANDFGILTNPTVYTEVNQYTTVVLGVSVDLSSVNGDLSYQWYSTSDQNQSGVAVEDETSQSILVDTSTVGRFWYYVKITNTVGDSTKSINSTKGQVVTNQTDVPKPNFVYQPLDGSVVIGSYSTYRFDVFVTSDVTLKYQWFLNTALSNQGGTEIEGANSPSYSISISDDAIESTQYYYAKVTSVKDGVSVYEYSEPAQLDILDKTLENNISILSDIQVVANESTNGAIDLSINIDTSEIKGELRYQWYSSDSIDGESATAINGAVGTSWRVYNDQKALYYFVEVTNILDSKQMLHSDSMYGVTDITHINTFRSKAIMIGTPQSIKSNAPAIVWGTTISVILAVVVAVGVVLLIKNKRNNKPVHFMAGSKRTF